MINAYVYIYKNNEWTPLKCVYPVEIKTGLNEELDSGTITFYSRTGDLYKPLTMVKVVLNDQNIETQNAEYNTKTMYFYGSDRAIQVNSTTWKHTIDLVEPTKRLEGYKIDGRAIVQPENTADRISLYTVINDLLYLTPLGYGGTDAQPFMLTSDPKVMAALQGVQSPEFRWDSQTTLWECLKDIGAYIDAIPRLTANAAETKFNTVTFDFVNEVVEIIDSMTYHNRADSYNESQYCSALETTAENIIATDQEEASVIYPGNGLWITPRTDEIELTTDNCKIILPYNIEKLLHVYIPTEDIIVYYKKNGETQSRPYSLSFFTTLKEVDIVNWVPEYKQWLTLERKFETVDAFYGTLYKNNSFYWEQGTNIINVLGDKYKTFLGIFNFSVYKTLYASVYNHLVDEGIIQPTYNIGEDLYRGGTKITGSDDLVFTKIANPMNWRFRVEYIPINTATKTRAVKTNKVDTEFTQTYNQRAQVNNATAFGRNMKGTVDKMGVKTRQLVKTYSTLNDVLDVGTAYREGDDLYIITSVSYNLLSHYLLAVTYDLSKNWNLISQYVGIDRRFRSWKIPDDILVRNLHEEQYCVIEREYATTSAYSHLRLSGREYLFNVLSENYINNTNITNCWIEKSNKTIIIPGESQNVTQHIIDYVVLSANSFAVGNSLVFNANTMDNLSAGKNRNDADSKRYCRDVFYCNEDGTLNSAGFIFASEFLNSSDNANATIDENAFPEARCYQLIGYDPHYTNYYKNSLIASYFNAKKTPAEQLNYTFQVHFVTDLRDVIIGTKLTENNPLVKQHTQNKVFKVWGLTKSLPKGIIKLNNHYGAYNAENEFVYSYTSDEAEIESVTINGTEFIGWAITDENDYLYLAQNSMIGAKTEDGKLIFETPLYLNIKERYHGE